MNSEKFSLRWNDFQSTVSQSLGLLRKEEDFFDVTLVSEDHSQMSADFLQAAQRLNVKGLMGEGEESSEHKHHLETKYREEVKQIGDVGDIVENEMVEDEMFEISNSNHRIVDRIKIQDNTEANERINELIEKVDGGFSCKACGKISKEIRNHKRHVETHIEGLSYSCQFCDKVFRYSNSRNIHMTRYHRN